VRAPLLINGGVVVAAKAGERLIMRSSHLTFRERKRLERWLSFGERLRRMRRLDGVQWGKVRRRLERRPQRRELRHSRKGQLEGLLRRRRNGRICVVDRIAIDRPAANNAPRLWTKIRWPARSNGKWIEASGTSEWCNRVNGATTDGLQAVVFKL
jgi:hypothetical protein